MLPDGRVIGGSQSGGVWLFDARGAKPIVTDAGVDIGDCMAIGYDARTGVAVLGPYNGTPDGLPRIAIDRAAPPTALAVLPGALRRTVLAVEPIGAGGAIVAADEVVYWPAGFERAGGPLAVRGMTGAGWARDLIVIGDNAAIAINDRSFGCMVDVAAREVLPLPLHDWVGGRSAARAWPVRAVEPGDLYLVAGREVVGRAPCGIVASGASWTGGAAVVEKLANGTHALRVLGL
jgi:hypothetical protein